MTDFSDFDDSVELFFDEFGFEATYISQSTSSYNTATGENTVTTTETTVQAILMDLTLQSNGLSAKFGTLVQAGDKELYIRPPEKVDPLDDPLVINPGNDRVRVNGVEYKVHTMKEINTTSAEPLLYDLYIRR